MSRFGKRSFSFIFYSRYKDRPEVREWQEKQKEIAKNDHFTTTLLGRYRNLGRFFTSKKWLAQQGYRRSINTPIQGGAADIVVAAMVKIASDSELKRLGYKLLLQIHDEVILEGPEENAQEALKRTIHLMEHPLDNDLLLDLEVDASIGNSWYEAK